jgi:hypothetical protein
MNNQIKIKSNFYQKLLQSKNLYITLHNKEHIVTNFELIDDKFCFICDRFDQSFGENYVKLKF